MLIALAVLLAGYITWRVLRRHAAPPHAGRGQPEPTKSDETDGKRPKQAAEVAPGEPAAGQHTQDRHAPDRS